MTERLWPQGIRGRLVAAMVLAIAAILVVTFLVLHRATHAALADRIDDQLEADQAEFEALPAATATTPEELPRSALASSTARRTTRIRGSSRLTSPMAASRSRTARS